MGWRDTKISGEKATTAALLHDLWRYLRFSWLKSHDLCAASRIWTPLPRQLQALNTQQAVRFARSNTLGAGSRDHRL